MALINRISRLFHADMNAVLDQIEEPEILLRQAIREMQENLGKQQSQIKLAEYEQQQLTKKEHEIKQFLNELEEQLQLCFKSNKDDLAHSLVKRKLETKQSLKAVSAKIVNSTENTSQLTAIFKEQQKQLSNMQQKADILSPDKTSGTTHFGWSLNTLDISDEDIEIAFLQEKQNWSQS